MHRLALICIAWLLISSPAIAELLANGVSIASATDTMQASGYIRTSLAIAPAAGEVLHFWKVDKGVLIIRASKANEKIAGLSFWFADERARASRQTFEFNVGSFDPETGDMTIRTKKTDAPNGTKRPSENERTKR